jgi:hypothetical protein
VEENEGKALNLQDSQSPERLLRLGAPKDNQNAERKKARGLHRQGDLSNSLLTIASGLGAKFRGRFA